MEALLSLMGHCLNSWQLATKVLWCWRVQAARIPVIVPGLHTLIFRRACRTRSLLPRLRGIFKERTRRDPVRLQRLAARQNKNSEVGHASCLCPFTCCLSPSRPGAGCIDAGLPAGAATVLCQRVVFPAAGAVALAKDHGSVATTVRPPRSKSPALTSSSSAAGCRATPATTRCPQPRWPMRSSIWPLACNRS